MSKRREPADPFGVSLLDVLSNALGGVILLMLIVAVTIKGNDKRRVAEELLTEQGEIFTDQDHIQKRSKYQYGLFLVQVTLIGSETNLVLTGKARSCTLGKSSANRVGARNDWFVQHKGETSGTWELWFDLERMQTLPDSVGFLVTQDGAAIISIKLPVRNRTTPILKVQGVGPKKLSEMYLLGRDFRSMVTK